MLQMKTDEKHGWDERVSLEVCLLMPPLVAISFFGSILVLVLMFCLGYAG